MITARFRFTSQFASGCYRALNSSSSINSNNLVLKKNLYTYRWSPALNGLSQSTAQKPALRYLLALSASSHQSAYRQPTRKYASDKKKEEVNPEERIKQIKEEIGQLERAVEQLKGPTKAAGKEVEVEEGKYDKPAEDDEEVVYRLAYDFPGFKLKNIRVSVFDQILKVYAFQTSSKKDTKEYIYENTTEEILPNEVDVNKLKATFDSENGFLIVSAILPEESNLKEIQTRAKELNDKLFKLDKELEAKKKELSSIKV